MYQYGTSILINASDSCKILIIGEVRQGIEGVYGNLLYFPSFFCKPKIALQNSLYVIQFLPSTLHSPHSPPYLSAEPFFTDSLNLTVERPKKSVNLVASN